MKGRSNIGGGGSGGSGGGTLSSIIEVTHDVGATIIANPNFKQKVISSTQTLLYIKNIGTYTITAIKDGLSDSKSVSIVAIGQYFHIELVCRVPAEYQAVEYLESAGTQYILLPIGTADIASGDIGWVQTTAVSYACIFGGTAAAVINTSSTIGLYISSSNSQNGFWYAGTKTSLATTAVNTYYSFQFIIGPGSQTYILNGSTTTASSSASVTPSGTVALYTMNYGGTIKSGEPSKARVYYFVARDSNGDVILYLQPCYRRSDSVAGMYDRVSGSFLTNSGTGTFVVGGDI